MFFAKSRAVKANKKSIEKLYFTHTLTIPGYSEQTLDNPLVFVQPGDVYAPGGIKCDAVLMRSCNQEFINQYGEFYFIVSNAFAKMSNKMQIGILQYEAVRSDMEIELTFGMGYGVEVFDLLHAYPTSDRPVAEHTSVQAVEAVAGVVGNFTAVRIGKKVTKQEMAAATRNACLINATRKQCIKSNTTTAYKKPVANGMVKKANKAAAKGVKNVRKQMVDTGAGQGAKPKADPLETAANALRNAGSQAAAFAQDIVDSVTPAVKPDDNLTPPPVAEG